MRKICTLLVLLFFATFANSQITIAGSTGTANGSYTSLTNAGGAFAALNTAGSHNPADVITISITGDVTGELGSIALNAGTWGSITVTPTGARTISGTTLAVAPLQIIDFNGADNVTINGLNSGGNSLTISNLSTSNVSGTSTIRFIGGATNNTITNCSIQGSGTMSVATNGATIFFSTDAVTANGNDNNTISNNNIGPAGSNLPTKAILGNGSTSTSAIGNSGNIISNNNIFDYFGAAVTSSGVATNGGCNTWTITNNRFYQTGTRTWTTGATHRAIDIGSTTATSGAQGFTITGNIIGYANNTQTGTYTLTGSNGKFQGIVYNGITGSTLSTVNNNTVASVSVSGVTSSGTGTTASLIGILAQNGVVQVNNNTIGSQVATGSLVLSTTTTAASDAIGIYMFPIDNTTSNDNNIGGISFTNAGASGTCILYGLRANQGVALTWTSQNNTIGGSVANSMQLTATGTSSQVIGMIAATAIANLTSNTIRNLTNNTGTGTTTAASVIGISTGTSTTPNHTISQNTIFNLTNTNTTLATIVTGIQFNGGTANIVQRNLIYGLTSATTSTTGEINGIRVSGGTTVYRNNIIAIGAGVTNALGSAASNGGVTGLNGINEFLGTNSFWHNSVYIGGSPTAGTGASYAFNGSQTVNTRSFRNNIFFNARSNSGASGSNYAVKINGTAANPSGLTINNNVYFANGTGGVFGYFNSANVANLAAWQTAVGQDAASIEADPLFVSSTDLQLQAGSPAIDVATNLGVTNDHFGKLRPGANALYDIGADERDGIVPVANDIQATAFIDPTNGGSKAQSVAFSPQASFTNNGTANQTSVTVRYRILTNPGNVEIYNQTFVIPSLATLANTTVTFPSTTIATAGLYNIIARAELAGDAVTTNDQIAGTLNILAPMAGVYTVGSGGNFPSLTNAAGAFETLNNLGASAPITFNIISDLTGELGTVALNEVAGGFTVLIQPTGAPRSITGSNIGSLIKINGADNVTINGSTIGATAATCQVGGNAAIRELTIQNTNTGTNTCVISIQSGTNGGQNNTIKNVNILGQDPTTTLLGISLGGNTPGTTGIDNDNNTVENCSVRRALFGIYSAGANLANQNTGTLITRNDLSATLTDRVSRVGIVIFNDNGVQVIENNIGGLQSTASADVVGIGLGAGASDASISTTAVTAGGVTNALVSKNKINGVNAASSTGYSGVGIAVAGDVGGPNTISNNMITGVTAPSTSPDLPMGIFVAGVTGSITRVYNNSISMTGNRDPLVAGQMPSYGIAITGTDPTVDLQNNIVYTTQTSSGGGASASSYAIGMASTTFTNLTNNYNNYWSTGANDGGFRTGSLGAGVGTDYATVALFATAVADEANSIEVLPSFVSDLNDLHLTPSTSCVTTGKGIAITGITNDIDCNSRNTVPFIGAHEAYEPATAATVISNNNDERTYTITSGTDFLFDCRLIASVTPGTVAGRMRARTSIVAPATNAINSEPYGPRVTDLDPTTDGTGTVRLYYTQQDFTDYNAYLTANSIAYNPIAANPTDPAISNVRIREWHGPNAGTGPGTGNTLLVPTTVTWDAAGNNGNGWWVVTVSAPSFSSFFLTSPPIVTPVTLVGVRGEVTGATNTVYWTTATEVNNRKFVVERSTNGSNFTAIGDVSTRAINGNSSTALQYNFVDANPVQGKAFYRLQMVDNGGRTTYSPIVTLRRGAGKLEIVDVRPNPTTGTVYFNVLGTSTNVNVAVRDLSGKEVIRKGLVQSNSFSIDMSKLANGMYILEAVDVRNGEKAVFKVMKQ